MSDYINRQPDEILVKIFNFLSTKDQIALEIVCIRWQRILLGILQSETSLTLVRPSFQLNRQQLKFFDANFEEIVSNPQNHLKSSSISTFNCETLVRKLPNVTKLVLIGIEISASDFAQIIFPNWNQLESLHYGVVSANNDYDWNVWQNGVAQNLTNLKHLALLGSVSNQFRLNWPFFRQLESLCLELEPDNSHYLNDLFQNVGPQLCALSLTNIEWDEGQMMELETMFIEEPELAQGLANNLARLTLESSDGNYPTDYPVFRLIAEYFTALTHLDVYLSEWSDMSEVVIHLDPLTSLTNLRLSTFLQPNDHPVRLFDGKFEDYEHLDSVKTLHLNIPDSVPKVDFYTNVLTKGFPFLEKIRIENSTGSMYQCNCERLNYTDEIECKCADEIFGALMEKNLKFLYRNDQLLFDRSNVDVDVFKQRLQSYG